MLAPGQYHSTVMATYGPCVYVKDAPLTSLSPSRRLTGGSAPGGALRGGRGCRRVRQAEIDDRERHRRGAALSCRVTRLSLWGGGAVRAGAAFASGRRRAAWNRNEGKPPQCAVTLANESLSCETGLTSALTIAIMNQNHTGSSSLGNSAVIVKK